MKILFVGPQGSGKSTQAKLLADYLKVPYISTGDIFRQLREAGSEEGKRIREIYDLGKLIDDPTTVEIVKKRLSESDCVDGFILDGYPRNIEQVKLYDPGFDKVIYLKISDEEALKRLLARGRVDDTRELIAERLRIYHQLTDPILDYYQQKGSLITIEGLGTIDDIQNQLREVVSGQK